MLIPRSVALLILLLSACGGDDGDGGTPDGGMNGADAGVRPECDVEPGDPIPYMCPCEVVDDMCVEGERCFGFNAKGPHCSHDCSGPEDCPAPSGGCNNMGVCKAPD